MYQAGKLPALQAGAQFNDAATDDGPSGLSASDDNSILCPVGCGNKYTSRGLAHYMKACTWKAKEAEKNKEYENSKEAESEYNLYHLQMEGQSLIIS